MPERSKTVDRCADRQGRHAGRTNDRMRRDLNRVRVGCHACGVQSRSVQCIRLCVAGRGLSAQPVLGCDWLVVASRVKLAVGSSGPAVRIAWRLAAGAVPRPTDSLSVCTDDLAVFAFVCTDLGGVRFFQATLQVRSRMVCDVRVHWMPSRSRIYVCRYRFRSLNMYWHRRSRLYVTVGPR